MPTLFSTGGRLSPLASGALLGLLGLGINYFGSIELIPGISLLLGSFFSMLALFRFGLAAGLLASLISSSFSLILFNHPWAMVIFTAELLAVFFVSRRFSLDPVTSCILYWLCGGELVSLFFHYRLLGLPLDDALLIMLKQAVNGVMNVLFAQLAYLTVRYREQISMRILLFYLAGTALTLPVLLYVVVDARKEFRKHLEGLASETEHVSRLGTVLLNQQFAVGTPDITRLKELLVNVVGNHTSNITLLDRDSLVIVSTRQDSLSKERLTRTAGSGVPLPGSRILHHIPAGKESGITLQRMQHSSYILDSTVPLGIGWRLVVEAPLHPVIDETTNMLRDAFVLMTVLILLTLVLAHLIARSMTGSLAQLGSVTEQLLLSGPELTVVASYPDSRITEVAALTADLRRIGTALFDQQQDLKLSHRQLQELAEHLTHVREEERKSVAREIHDELGMALTTLTFDASWIKRHYGQQDDRLKDRLAGMEQTLRQSVDAVRRIVSELRPWLLDELGLEATIEWHLGNVQTRTGITTRFIKEIPVDAPALHSILSRHMVNLYRIFQEAVTNSTRYAEASCITVTLASDSRQLLLRVADNGKGFAIEEMQADNSFGLLGMQERARLVNGILTISSTTQTGTTLELVIPVAPNGATSHDDHTA